MEASKQKRILLDKIFIFCINEENPKRVFDMILFLAWISIISLFGFMAIIIWTYFQLPGYAYFEYTFELDSQKKGRGVMIYLVVVWFVMIMIIAIVGISLHNDS